MQPLTSSVRLGSFCAELMWLKSFKRSIQNDRHSFLEQNTPIYGD